MVTADCVVVPVTLQMEYLVEKEKQMKIKNLGSASFSYLGVVVAAAAAVLSCGGGC